MWRVIRNLKALWAALVSAGISFTLIQVLPAGVVAVAASVLLAAVLTFVWDLREFFALIAVRRIQPGISPLSRASKSRAYGVLFKRFLRLEKLLQALQSGHKQMVQSYQDQIDIAECFYSAHGSSFWATSLDKWSVFVSSNEAYVQAMRREGAPLPSNPIEQAGAGAAPPQRCRIFVLPWHELVEDLLLQTNSARLLVLSHLRAWGTGDSEHLDSPMRVCLVDDFGEVTGFLSRHLETSCSDSHNEVAPVIPDVMIVDGSFVYGRVEPVAIPPDLASRARIVLQYSNSRPVVAGYEEWFSNLWDSSLDVYTFCSQIKDADFREKEPVAVTRSRSTLMALREEVASLKGVTDDDLWSAFATIAGRIGRDIANFYGNRERKTRYPEFDEADTGEVIIKKFSSLIQGETRGLVAVDQADFKGQPEPFWRTWRTEGGYIEFDNATRSCRAPKRRVFVIVEWDELLEEGARKFLDEQLAADVHVGLITRQRLEELSRSKALVGESSLVTFDSDFILLGVIKDSGSMRLESEARGFEVADLEFDATEINYKNLLTMERMKYLWDWFEHIWQHCNAKIEFEGELSSFIGALLKGRRSVELTAVPALERDNELVQ